MAACLPLAVVLVALVAATGASAHGYSQTPSPTPAPAAKCDKVMLKVEGMVYCQSCTHRNSWCLDGATPLPGAKVTVTCRDAKNRVMESRTPVADGNGYFLAEFDVAEKADYYKGDPAKACFVRLLASPDRKCDDLTNVNYGIEGAPLRHEGKRWSGKGYENVVYAARPLSFKPDTCAPRGHY
ncbi:hypothetical protein CFC21_046157 [Triticum aestivum]|uniref:Uncharacterized protein n=3 Tax=Triticinae TaxID=1648030 RepID=A0A453E4J2_AEGTS|nr:non-classical arabinogalactan protein 30-like [Aegilops tauschii subsp. strangulata]KAF7035244.1 hypothetical protein CFC21_046157 [Triticum aestivum]